MTKAIIFDMFGVIYPDNFPMAYRKFGGNYEADAQFIHDTLLASSRGMIPNSRSIFAKHLGVTVDEWMAAQEEDFGKDQELLNFILSLRQSYKIGLLSNISRDRLPSLFSDGELEKYFDVAVASSDIGYAKPEPQAYETVADQLGVRLEECIFTDDREEYCEGARSVGMQAIRYVSLKKFKTDLQKVLELQE